MKHKAKFEGQLNIEQLENELHHRGRCGGSNRTACLATENDKPC